MYEYPVGTVFVDDRWGLEWVLRDRLPGRCQLQLNKDGGPFINVVNGIESRIHFHEKKAG